MREIVKTSAKFQGVEREIICSDCHQPYTAIVSATAAASLRVTHGMCPKCRTIAREVNREKRWGYA